MRTSIGKLKYWVLAQQNWDAFTTSTDPAVRNRICTCLTGGIGTFTPNPGDSILLWFPEAWAYVNSYGIDFADPIATQHPEWILKDAAGNKLFIPSGCDGTKCARYAGDFTNQGFIGWKLGVMTAYLSPGYLGLFLDDVNLEFRCCDAWGNPVVPINVATKQPFTQSQWASGMATFMERIRSAFPSHGIIHNALWTAPAGAAVTRQTNAADFVYFERFNDDTNLTGGTGQYSLQSYMAAIDAVHNAGTGWRARQRGAIFGPYKSDNQQTSMALALLVTNGNDWIGWADQVPDSTWPDALMSMDLGAALGARYKQGTVWRRDFERGAVLLNEPGAASVTLSLPTTMRDSEGVTYVSLPLRPMQGLVLRF